MVIGNCNDKMDKWQNSFAITSIGRMLAGLRGFGQIKAGKLMWREPPVLALFGFECAVRLRGVEGGEFVKGIGVFALGNLLERQSDF